MDLSKIKLIATDIDGTLLNSNHELSDTFYPIFHSLVSKGILFAAASGRQFYNLVDLFETIQDDMIFIAENGSYVVHKGKDILVQAMGPEITREQMRIAREIPDTYIILCGKKTAYVENASPVFLNHVKTYYHKHTIVDDLMKVEDDDFLKIAICDLAGAEGNSNNFFQRQKEFLQVTVSGKIWLDISHQLANKGRALDVVQKIHSITPEETLVFGDYLNDIGLIQQAHFSFAMENAHPDVKKLARYTAKSNDENGVLDILQQMVNL